MPACVLLFGKVEFRKSHSYWCHAPGAVPGQQGMTATSAARHVRGLALRGGLRAVVVTLGPRPNHQSKSSPDAALAAGDDGTKVDANDEAEATAAFDISIARGGGFPPRRTITS